VEKCPLCKANDESLSHIFIDYYYDTPIWKDVELLIGMRNVWGGKYMETRLNEWCGREKCQKI
jgi:hypothetical protein